MSVLKDLLAGRVELDDRAVDHLQLLLAEWQILSDLAFADLLLFVREGDRPWSTFLCVGQMRPYTAQTLYQEDLVGRTFSAADRPMVARAFGEQRVIRDAEPDWSTGLPVREEAIPVRHAGQVIAVVTQEASVSTARSPSQLELTYLRTAADLAIMLAEGAFPYPGDIRHERELSPRVGDGVMRTDAHGIVTYASPNAISAYRRLGRLDDVVGKRLVDFCPTDTELARALTAVVPAESELERDGAIVLLRLLPLTAAGTLTGALGLVRDVTELRRHEQALRVKDATIREIHHRVKNNLQTVASLLRLQSRRLESQEARAALAESVRRVSSIALVHETLSQESRQRMSFDQVAGRIMTMLADGLLDPQVPVRFEMAGSAGYLPAELATPLALVLTELLQNCVQHAFGEDGGTVRLTFDRRSTTLRVVVADDGRGLPTGQPLERIANLGLQIARMLVESELGGTFDPRPVDRGTTIELTLPLPLP